MMCPFCRMPNYESSGYVRHLDCILIAEVETKLEGRRGIRVWATPRPGEPIKLIGQVPQFFEHVATLPTPVHRLLNTPIAFRSPPPWKWKCPNE